MVDKRFFGSIEPVALTLLLEAVGAGKIEISPANASLMIANVSTLEQAGPRDIALAAKRSYADRLRRRAPVR